MTPFARPAALLLLFLPSLAHAGSYRAIDDRTMVAGADGIAVVVTLSEQSFVASDGLILTDHLVVIEESLKGDVVAGDTIVIREVGGTVGDRSLVASTAPRFDPGEKALVFLSRTASGAWSTYSGGFGKFDFAHENGATVLVRAAADGEIVGAGPEDSGAGRVRDAEEFLSWIMAAVARGEDGLESSATPLEGEVEIQSAAVASAAANVWNSDPTSTIAIGVAGSPAAISFGSMNGTNAAHFNVAESFTFGSTTPLAGAALGYSLLWAINTPHQSPLGETYYTAVECDILLEAGLGGPLLTEITAHEMGHCLGFRHSNVAAPSSNNALMYIFSGGGALLRAWDRDAANQVYGDGTFGPASTSGSAFLFVINGLSPPGGARWDGGSFTMATFVACSPPVITSHPQSKTISSGFTTTLTVGATGATSYQWYQGGSPATGTPIPGATSSTYTTPQLTASQTYSVRVTNACDSVNSVTATITVTCTPIITAQPKSSTVSAGQGVTLTVTATNATSFQWFRGSSGSTAEPIGGATSASYQTGPLAATSSFWVRVGNSCGTVNSTTATITVCALPSITAQPQNASIQPGQSATLSVAANDATTYQWYRGAKGTTTDPVAGATSSSLTTGALSATTQYWVRVGNSCGAVDSEAATVTVGVPCVAPQITTHPVSGAVRYGNTQALAVEATGTELRYQWYAGPTDDFGRPMAGANGANFTTTPLRANAQFWAYVSNGCGSARSATATLTIAAEVVVASLPDAIVQMPDRGGAASSLTLTNLGGTPTPVTLTREGDFFTIDPPSFELAPGASRHVTLTGAARPSGSYGGAVLASGAGVPQGLRVPVRMLVAPASIGQVDARPDENRVDIGAPAEQEVVEGTVGFTNFGNQSLTGMVTADVPWIEIPEPLVTIAPGARITIRFLIRRSLRSDGDDPFGSTVGNLYLQYLAGTGAAAADRLVRGLGGTGVSTTLVTVTDTAKPKTKVGAPPPLAEGEIALFASSVGHVQSPVGTFISDVYLASLKPMANLSVYYTRAGQPLASTVAATVPSLTTLRPVAFTDLTKTVFEQDNGLGTLQIRGADLASLKISASVFNKSNAAGTYGSAVPVLRSDTGVRAGESMFITGLVASSAAGRTNLIVQELIGSDALIAVDLLDANGSVIATKEDLVPAFQHIRMNDFVPAGAVAAVVRLRGTTGSVLAYATPLDALSGDTWVVTDWPRVQGFDPAGRQIIPIAGKLEGANANYFRSTMALVNQASSPASVVARFVSNAGAVSEKTLTIPPRGTMSYNDAIAEVFGLPSGIGFLEIDPQGTPVVVTSRTFATIGDDPKTFGTGVPAVASSSMKAGDAERISGFDDADQAVVTAKTPATFRTNLGLVETKGKGATVRVTIHFRHPVSTTVTAVGSASKEYLLAPRQFLLLQGVAAQILGDFRSTLKGNLKDLFVDIEVVSGDGEVIAFASSVDNGTGDQLFKLQ